MSEGAGDWCSAGSWNSLLGPQTDRLVRHVSARDLFTVSSMEAFVRLKNSNVLGQIRVSMVVSGACLRD